MMDKVVAALLNRLLKDYVKKSCFTPEKIQTDMWQGHLCLEALELKPEILDGPWAPLFLSYGRNHRPVMRPT